LSGREGIDPESIRAGRRARRRLDPDPDHTTPARLSATPGTVRPVFGIFPEKTIVLARSRWFNNLQLEGFVASGSMKLDAVTQF
jgi:hypothetical protein